MISGQNVTPGREGEVLLLCYVTNCTLSINPNDIGISHRIGKRNVNAPDLRSILVKLSTNEAEQNIMNACKTAKPERLFIKENLSPARNSLCMFFAKLRKTSLILCPDVTRWMELETSTPGYWNISYQEVT